MKHGPYCCLCGACRPCAEDDPLVLGHCYDAADGKHVWNRVDSEC